MEKVKMRAAGPHAKKMVRGEDIICTLILLANGRWAIYDKDERQKLSGIYYETAQRAFTAAKPLAGPA